jgi:hypothetical protein
MVGLVDVNMHSVGIPYFMSESVHIWSQHINIRPNKVTYTQHMGLDIYRCVSTEHTATTTWVLASYICYLTLSYSSLAQLNVLSVAIPLSYSGQMTKYTIYRL